MKKVISTTMFICLLAASLCGCSSGETVVTVATSTSPAASEASVDAVEVLRDISTTQYFTDEEVAQEDVQTILDAGINAPSAMNGQPWHFSVITNTEVLQQISEGMSGGMSFNGTPPDDADGEFQPSDDMTLPEGFDGEVPEEFDGEMPENFAGENAVPMEKPAGGTGTMNKAGITDAPLVIVISCKTGSELDAGLACQNMSATAHLLGYGTKIISSPTIALNGSEEDTYREVLGIPEDYSAVTVLLIGYEDTSVDTTVDGYTGATTRVDANEVVTYVN